MAGNEDVNAPVVVAALVNWNDGLAVINAVSEHPTCIESELYQCGVDLLERIVAMLTKLIDP